MAAQESCPSASNSPVNILAFGASLTEGYYSRGFLYHPYSQKLQQLLEGAGIPAKVLTSGRSGERVCTSMISRLPKELLQHQQSGLSFSWVLIIAGINDLGHGASPETVYDGLKALYRTCKQYNARVLAMTLMENDSDHTPLGEARSRVNELLRALQSSREPSGAGFEHVTVLDLEREMPLHALTAPQRQELWDDGLHLTPQGYDRMGEIIFNALQPLLAQQLEQHAAPQ